MVHSLTEYIPRYKAFISYSHAADGKLAPRLQSALHRFARPWYRRRAIHVFRDDTNLSISPGLWTSIEKALGVSEYFVLLASPQAAVSQWVDKEVNFWLSHRSPDTLLIVLTEGELWWDSAARDFDWSKTTALPARLSNAFPEEPLFLDLRWARSTVDLALNNPTFRDKIADLSATLRGLSKDEIIGEDVHQHRRTKIIAWAAGIALFVLTLVSTAAAWTAIVQRNEAVRQRNFALARQLAAQADLARQGGNPEHSTTLATEAVRILSSLQTRVLEVDLSLRRSLAVLAQPMSRFEEHGSAEELAFSADGQYITAQLPHGGYYAVRGVATGWLLRRVEFSGGYRLHIGERVGEPFYPKRLGTWLCGGTPDGRFIVVGSYDGGDTKTIEVWEPDAGRRVASLELSGANLRCNISPDGALLAITSPESHYDKGAGRWQPSMRIWRTQHQQDVLTDVLTREQAEFLAFSPDGVHFATSTGLWRFADASAVRPHELFTWQAKPWRLKFSPTGRYVAIRANDYDAPIEIRDLYNDRAPTRTQPLRGRFLAVSDDGKEVIMSSASTYVWNVRNNRELVGVPLEAGDATFGNGEPLILTTSIGNSGARLVSVWQLKVAGASMAVLKMPASDRVHWIKFGPGKELRTLIEGRDAMRIDVWYWDRGTTVTLLTVPSPAPPTWTINANGDHYAILSHDKVVVGRVDGTGMQVEIPQQTPPLLLALSATGTFLATAQSDLMEGWNIAQPGSPIAAFRFKGSPAAVRVSPDGAIAAALIVEVEGDKISRAGPSYTIMRWRTMDPSSGVQMNVGRHLKISPCELAPDARNFYFTDERKESLGRNRPQSTGENAAGPQANEETTDASCEGVVTPHYRAQLQPQADALGIVDRQTGKTLTYLEHPGKIRLIAFSRDEQYLASVDETEHVRVWPMALEELLAQACARLPRTLTSKEWQDAMGSSATHDSCGRPLTSDTDER